MLPSSSLAGAANVAPRSGVIVIHAPSGPALTTTSTNWETIPQMKGAITLRSTSDLAITFCARADTSAADKRMFVRVLVDGQPANPSDVVFAAGSGLHSHCFTFVKNGVGLGQHAVVVQWRVDAGGTNSISERNLTITFAPADAEELALLAVAAPSGPDQVHSGGWSDIPNLSGTIQLAATSDLAISLHAEAYTTNNARCFVRALVDGQVASPHDAVLVLGGFNGARTFTFTKEGVGPGSHQVQLQWLVDDVGQGHLGDRTLLAIGAKQTDAKHVGHLLVATESPWLTTTSQAWSNVPDLNGSFYMPSMGDVTIQFVAAVCATGENKRLFLRALLDGQPTEPSDNVLVMNACDGAYAFAFVKRNVGRGQHTVQLQWLIDSGGTGAIADRTMTVHSFTRQVPILFVAMESDRGAADYAYGGYFASSVAETVGGQRVFRGYVAERLFLGFPSIADYFLENSADRLHLVWTTPRGALGPYMKQYNEKYYREQVPDPFTTMKVEALTRADQDFDYSLYDRNGNGTVTRDELFLNVIFYYDMTFGEVRNVPAIVTNDGVTLDANWTATVYTPDFRETEIGVFVHELSHAIVNAGDMYETTWDPTAPGPYSLMDQHGGHPHLDPYHKLHAGNWFDPITVNQDGYYDIAAVENQPQIFKLRDPGSHQGEYFLVENRQRISYDSNLPDTGLAVWHIDEPRGAENYRTAVEMAPACGATNPVQWQNYLYDGAGSLWGVDLSDSTAPAQLRWHDGGLTHMGVWAVPASSEIMRVYLDVPGAGILVDVQPASATAPSGGTATFQVRLVNTGLSADTFTLGSSLPGGWTTWSANPVSLASYEERIVDLTVRPTWTGQNEIPFDVAAQSTTNPIILTNHPATIQRAETTTGKIYVPLTLKPQP